MRPNILPGNIRDKALIAKFFGIQDQANFVFLLLAPKLLGAQKDAQFQGHIEPGKAGLGIQLNP